MFYMQDYWYKQSADKPAFPDLQWSRPENKKHAGKLLIVGGNQYGFVEPAEAFRFAEAAGIGVAQLLLPDSLKRFVGPGFNAGQLAPSTPSGSFSQKALGNLLEMALWADGVLLAGGLGHNSETAILIEKFLEKYSGPVTITKDAADYCLALPKLSLDRTDTLLVITMAQLQKLGTAAKVSSPFTLGMDLLRLVDGLHDFTQKHTAHIIVRHHDQIVVAVNGYISTTPYTLEMWRVKTAALASVWWLQNPEKAFEGITTSLFEPSS